MPHVLSRFLLPRALLLVWAWLGTAGASGQTVPSKPPRLVPLHNGVNAVDLDGDGQPDLVVVAHRENYNAHSFDVSTFYLRSKDDDGKPQLEVVPVEVEGEGATEELSQTTAGGADGLLHDYRLVRDSAQGRAVVLITARRRFGASFADPERVVFRFYRLERNADGGFGWPARYFQRYKKQRARKRYADVTAAFRDELGLPPDRGQTTEE